MTGTICFSEPHRDGHMHVAGINSARLQRVLALLCDGERHSPLDISTRARAMYNPAVTELRHNGIVIYSAPEEGRRWHWYWIAAENLDAARSALRECGNGHLSMGGTQ